MIIDINAWTGHWNTHPVIGDVASVRASLLSSGVAHIFLSPLDAAWCPNQHQHNRLVYDAATEYPEIIPVPVLDPTLPTWCEELERALMYPRLHLIKLLPGYVPYHLDVADRMCGVLADKCVGIIIQIRIDDPRHQHPLATASDVPVDQIVDMAKRHPQLTVIAGGPSSSTIQSIRDPLHSLQNLFVDVSQVDGMDAILNLVKDGLMHKLLFGSHAPVYVPAAALARVVIDLTDEEAAPILGGNAARLFELSDS